MRSIDQIVQIGNESRIPIPFHLCIESVPDACSLESYYRGVRKGPAPGVDGIANDVYEIAPLINARLYAPLYAKMALQVREPLSLKGGSFHLSSRMLVFLLVSWNLSITFCWGWVL